MEYTEDLRVGMVLCGGTAYCYSQEELDELVGQLQQYEGHKGVIITGYKPWTVTVMHHTVYYGEDIQNYPGKYFKCIKGQYKNKIVFVDERLITMLVKYSEGVPDGFELTEFVEVKPTWNEVL